MSDTLVTVIGAGAIGTSLGLALKQVDDGPRLVIHDKNRDHVNQAMKMGAFDRFEWNLINACDQADLIVLAVPGVEIKGILKAIAADVKPDVVITDTASTKNNICQLATKILPKTAHFVGGHPIVATNTGPAYARADLFQKSLYCLTPTAKVIPDAVNLLENMIALIEAIPFFLDPAEHDGLTAGVNGLPTLLSLALVNTLSQSNSWVELRKLAGGLFSQVSAGATGDAESLAEELVENKENVLRWLDTFITDITQLRDDLATDKVTSLAEKADEAITTHTIWEVDFEQKRLSDLREAPVKFEKRNLLKDLLGFGKR